MSMKMKIEGAGDIERALGALARGTAKGVTRRAMKKALQPVARAAEGSPFVIAVTSKLARGQKGRARRDQGRSKIAMYVGPVQQDGSHAPHAHLIEFGTGDRYHESGKYVGAVMADPFMRPAWDANRERVLEILKREIWAEIEKTIARAARKAARG
ncbi:phage protein, HK97 gp10 family [Phaeobacter inhibens]|nr:phage protein, HK97 gp10 family [Phaeobacter inhibens]